jgi:hypothetical protein
MAIEQETARRENPELPELLPPHLFIQLHTGKGSSPATGEVKKGLERICTVLLNQEEFDERTFRSFITQMMFLRGFRHKPSSRIISNPIQDVLNQTTFRLNIYPKLDTAANYIRIDAEPAGLYGPDWPKDDQVHLLETLSVKLEPLEGLTDSYYYSERKLIAGPSYNEPNLTSLVTGTHVPILFEDINAVERIKSWGEITIPSHQAQNFCQRVFETHLKNAPYTPKPKRSFLSSLIPFRNGHSKI